MKTVGASLRCGRPLAVLFVVALGACDDLLSPERIEGIWTSSSTFSSTDASVTGSFTLTLVSTGPSENLFGQGTLSSISFSVEDGSIHESGDPLAMTFDFGAHGTVAFDGRADSDTRLSGTLTGTVRVQAGVDDPRYEFVATPIVFVR